MISVWARWEVSATESSICLRYMAGVRRRWNLPKMDDSLPWWGCSTIVKACIETSTLFICSLGSYLLVWYTSSPNTPFCAKMYGAVSTAVVFGRVVNLLLTTPGTVCNAETALYTIHYLHHILGHFIIFTNCVVLLFSYCTLLPRVLQLLSTSLASSRQQR